MTARILLVALAATLIACEHGESPPPIRCGGEAYPQYTHPVLLGPLADEMGLEPVAFGQGGWVTVELHYGAPYRGGWFPLTDPSVSYRFCPELDASFTATLEGVSAEPDEPRWRCTFGAMAEPICQALSFHFEIARPLPATASIVFGDDSLSRTLPVGGL